MQGKPYFYGPEVEGRYTGIQTVFVREQFPEDAPKYPHIYFTVEFMEKAIHDERLMQDIITISDLKTQQITLEIFPSQFDKIPYALRNTCHILVRVSLPIIEKLKPSDTITLDVEPYNVYTITKWNMQHVAPTDYSFDSNKPTV
jgi:hypothetical protein